MTYNFCDIIIYQENQRRSHLRSPPHNLPSSHLRSLQRDLQLTRLSNPLSNLQRSHRDSLRVSPLLRPPYNRQINPANVQQKTPRTSRHVSHQAAQAESQPPNLQSRPLLSLWHIPHLCQLKSQQVGQLLNPQRSQRKCHPLHLHPLLRNLQDDLQQIHLMFPLSSPLDDHQRGRRINPANVQLQSRQTFPQQYLQATQPHLLHFHQHASQQLCQAWSLQWSHRLIHPMHRRKSQLKVQPWSLPRHHHQLHQMLPVLNHPSPHLPSQPTSLPATPLHLLHPRQHANQQLCQAWSPPWSHRLTRPMLRRKSQLKVLQKRLQSLLLQSPRCGLLQSRRKFQRLIQAENQHHLPV